MYGEPRKMALIVDARLTEANGQQSAATRFDMIEDNARPGSTVGGDRTTTPPNFVAGLPSNSGCRACSSQEQCTALPRFSNARTTRHPGYRIKPRSKRKRSKNPWLDEEPSAGLRKPGPSWARLGGMVLRP